MLACNLVQRARPQILRGIGVAWMFEHKTSNISEMGQDMDHGYNDGLIGSRMRPLDS